MFSWNFAKSAEKMLPGWVSKRLCKFLLKKKLGQLFLGDIDLNLLDVQLTNGSFQLSDLALNVDYLNQKFGETAMVAVKEGSIGSLDVNLPWMGRGGCQIEINELEIVLAPREVKTFQVGSETSTSTQDSTISSTNDLENVEHEMVDSDGATASVDLHEGVKTIAKMVKLLLTSFHVKIKKLIVVFDPSLGEVKNKVLSRTLVLRFSEVECGTNISEDINSDCQASVDRFLGLNRLTNFVKFDGAVLEFLQIDNDDSQSPNSCSGCCSSNATTPIIVGEKGGFSGTINLSIPWKNGSLDIRKVDADVNVDPLELRFQPSSIQSFLYLVDIFKEMGKNSKSGMCNTVTESVYYSAASHIHSSTLSSSEFAADKGFGNHESFSADSYSFLGKETVTDALLRGSHLISDWVTSPIYRNQKERTEEPDFGASVDQFFECFDDLRNSQSALGNSGMWNWTCSVFSAITAASNLASGSLHIPSEQKHVETNLKAMITGIRILFSLDDEEQKHSCNSQGVHKNSTSHVHYVSAEFQDMQLGLQVCPREMNFEATVKHIEVADHFSNGYDIGDIGLRGQDDSVKTQVESIRNLQAAVQGACPPFCSAVDDDDLANPRECTFVDVSSDMHSLSRCTSKRSCRGIYRDDVVKVILLQTSAVTQAQFTVASVSSDGTFSGPISFSLKLPPFVFWVNFQLITVLLELIKNFGNSLGKDSTENLSASEVIPGKCKPSSSQEDGSQSSSPHVTTLPSEGTLRGNIFLLNARVFLCFPCGKNEDFKSYSSWNQFIVLDFSSPYSLTEKKVGDSNPFRNSKPKERYSVTRSLHLNVGNLDIFAIASTSQYNDSFGKLKTKFSAQKVLSIANKAGHPSVFGMFWQEGCVTGPSIAKRAKVLATSDGMSSRHKFMGKGYEFVSVTTIKDMEDFNFRTRQEMLFSSAFLLHVHLFPVTVFLDVTQYKALHDLSNQIGDWLTCITSDPVGAKENSPFSQTSVLVECETVEFSLSVKAAESLKGSIQNELPGSWHRLKLNIRKFELLFVSNIGGIKNASFLWASHGEGNLWGSITEVPDQEFLLISCNDSARGRGGGEGSNILSSRSSGSDIVYLWDSESSQSHVSISIRCGTIVATGGRLDWLDSVISFFSVSSLETNQVSDDDVHKEDANGGSFILNLVDVGVSYEPYFCKKVIGEHSSNHCSANVDGKLSDQYVAGFLGASSLKLSNVMEADSTERDYKIRVQDLSLLLCEVSGSKKVGGYYSSKHLRKTGYVKVGQEAHVEALLRMNCKNGQLWEVECCDSHFVLGTCQDTTSGLIRLAAQLQQLFAPDIEDSVVHLQTRWDSVQQALETDGATNSSNHFSPSNSPMHTSGVDTNEEAGVINLMDEICEGAFCLDGNWENQSGICESEVSSPLYDILGEKWTFSTVDPESIGLENSPTSSQTSMTEFIEGYFISDLRPLSELSLNNRSFNENIETKFRTVKDEARSRNTGWYGDTSLRILENHVLNVGEKTNLNQLLDNEASCNQILNDDDEKVKGRVLLKNINVRWKLYGGSDWLDAHKNVQHASCYGRDTAVCLELALSGIGVQYNTFPDGEICVSRLSFSIQDFRLYDNSKDAPWKQVLGYYQSKNHPRDSSSKALKLDLEVVRPNPSTPLEEYRLRIALHPMRLHLHQCQLDFLISFFGGKGSSNDHSQISQDQSESGMAQDKKGNHGSYNIIEEALLPYFQKFDIQPVLLRVDYSPSRVDLAALRGGKYVELVNLVSWKGVELQLKHVQAVGVYGWSSVCETILGEWLEDISQNQIHKLLKGLPPIRSLVAVGSGAAKLVSLPLKSYRKDQKILKGMQRGTIAFLRSISREAIGLGVHLAAGAHDILLQAEYILASTSPTSVPRPLQSRVDTNVRSNQPKDARQGIRQAFGSITDGFGKSANALVQAPLNKYMRGDGVGSALATAVQAAPAAAMAPASAAARAMHVALLGVRNSIDPEHKKESMNKYHGTTQSQPR